MLSSCLPSDNRVRFTKCCWVGKHVNITMKPTNSPTKRPTEPNKNYVKSGILGEVFPQETFCMKPTNSPTKRPTQPNKIYVKSGILGEVFPQETFYMKPTNSPTKRPTEPNKNYVKSGILGEFFPTRNIFSWVGIWKNIVPLIRRTRNQLIAKQTIYIRST